MAPDQATRSEDEAPPGDDEGGGSGFVQSWGALVALCLTMFIVVLDSSMMNVAIPQISKDLNTDCPRCRPSSRSTRS